MPQRFSISGALGISIAAIALTAIFLLVMVPPLIIAAFGPGTGASEPGDRLSKLVARHDDFSKDAQERFNGRSAFFRPPPKFVPQPQVREEPKFELPKPDPGPPPPPANYTGPSLIAIVGDQAWFKPPAANEKPLRLNVGAERSGVKLLSTNPPWSVKVAHKGGEYDVTLFAKTYERYFTTNAPKLRSVVPGLNFQAPPNADALSSQESVLTSEQQQAANDAAIEARRLRASRLDESVKQDADARANQQAAGEKADDAESDETESDDEGDADQEPHHDDVASEEPQPVSEPESATDETTQSAASQSGEASPSENHAAIVATGRSSATKPK